MKVLVAAAGSLIECDKRTQVTDDNSFSHVL